MEQNIYLIVEIQVLIIKYKVIVGQVLQHITNSMDIIMQEVIIILHYII
jgi:hypothetical protein